VGVTDDDDREIRRATDKLLQAVAVLTTNVEHLGLQIASLTTSMVTREAHDALRETVQRNDDDCRERDEESQRRDSALQKGIDRNDARWAKLAWTIGLAVLGAVLTIVLYTGGAKP
jgi:hypothetical protein